MEITWLGWAGFEIEAEGERVVIDPLADPGATFAPLGDEAGAAPLPPVVRANGAGALAGMVTHLHRDHADGAALAAALAPGAPVYEPRWPGGEDVENLALVQANLDLRDAKLARHEVGEWDRLEAGPFSLIALPAVDGTGDPQVAWLVEAEGRRVLHLGDTIFHGYWWRMAQRHGPFDVVLTPINGAVVRFPHRRPASPLPAALDPEQGALVGELLGAEIVVPMHYGGYDIEPWYRPIADAAERFAAAARDRPFEARILEPGGRLRLTTGTG
jgi:L-ascorbate metabolism protein UlaG (beta-lactamase superfamily)